MDPSSEFLKQGLLGAIIVVEGSVIVFLYREVRKAYDNRITDLDTYKQVFLGTAKDLLASNQNLQKVVDGISVILQNVKFKK